MGQYFSKMHQPFTKGQNLDWSKIKALADDRINVTKKKEKFGMGRVENIVEKGGNAAIW